jgi:inosine-uridine nucleoside N-ribohydrolase
MSIWTPVATPALPRQTLIVLGVVSSLLVLPPPALGHTGKVATPGDRVPLVIDTDMGLDDVAAMLAIAGAPTVDIAAVTTVGGAARARLGAETAARLLALLGAPGVPVAVGEEPPTPAPPWRATAESLGGVALPAIGVAPRPDAVALLREVLAREDDGGVVMLALGPLTNLSRLLAADPAAGRKLKAVFLLGGPGERAWNLGADPAAARAVLRSGLKLVALPSALAGAVTVPADARALLGGSPAPGARWLARVWQGARHSGPLHDAALAAVVLGPDAVPGARPVTLGLDGTGRVTTTPGGRATVIEKLDPARASRLLTALWLETPPDQPEATRDGGPPLRRVAAFHGHLGPYVVLGYRLGLLARKLTGSEGYFDIAARPVTRGVPPEACFVDGVQLGSGATTGKGNLEPTVGDGAPQATFSGKNGRRVTLELAPGLVSWIGASIARHGVGPTGLWIFAAPTETLFTSRAAATR